MVQHARLAAVEDRVAPLRALVLGQVLGRVLGLERRVDARQALDRLAHDLGGLVRVRVGVRVTVTVRANPNPNPNPNQVAVNTDMSIGLAILVGFLSVAVTVALWCGLLQRLMQAGGILQEAADAARSLPALVLLLPPLLMLGLGLLFCYYIYVALLLASARPH